jgi:hypothetical protein
MSTYLVPSMAAQRCHEICKLIESNPLLINLLSGATTDAAKAFFLQNLLVLAPNAFEGCEQEPDRAFDLLTRWLGRYVAN